MNNMMDIEKGKGLLTPLPFGVGKASTFTGFCGHHDDTVFAPIEKTSFLTRQDHIFLFGYRHVCMELFTKESADAMQPLLRRLDQGLDEELQKGIQGFASLISEWQKTGLSWIKHVKGEFDKVLLSKDFTSVNYYVVRLSATPDLLCASGFFPTHDFDGNVLQDLMDDTKIPNHLSSSLVATETGGAAVFMWLGANPSAEQLIKSLHKLSDADLSQAMVRITFEFFENTYFSPKWWNALDEKSKMAIQIRVSNGADFTKERLPDCLKSDGNTYVNWTVTARETNLTL